MSASDPTGQDTAFARSFVRFVRGFGLLDQDHTPCGAPMSPAEAHALTVLLDGPTSQSGLGRQLRLPKSSVTRLVDGLAGRGWVARAPGPHDGRVRLVSLTAAGRRAAADVVRRRQARLAVLLDRVPADQRDLVVRALTLLEEATRDG
jgi:DNA-binding MarR family transcriptional regulator